MFNMAQHCFVDKEVLNKLELFTKSTWNLFLEEEFTSTLTKCNNLSIPSPNKLAWRYLKHILKDLTCLKNIINITNICLKLGYWPSYFKYYKLKTLELIKRKNLVLGLIQENLIESSVQDSLLYILKPHSLY